MRTPIPMRESPVPVFIVLVALLVFVELLHFHVIDPERSPSVIQIPAEQPSAGPFGDVATVDDDPAILTPDAESAAGHLHETSRALARDGQAALALSRLDASLAAEGKADPDRLQERGVLLMKLDRTREAIADLLEAGRLGGGSATLLYNLGLARARTGDIEGAEREYRRALAANPLFDEAWNNLALLLEDRGDRQGAIEALQKAVDLSQPSARYRPAINLARLLQRDGRQEEAIARLEDAIRFAPGEVASRLALGDIEAASPATVARARETYEEVIRLAPDDPDAYLHLGQLEQQQGDRAAAEHMYRESLRVNPASGKARHALAALCLDMGRAGEAVRHYEVLLDQGADARASFGLGRARRATGDVAGAVSAYREAVRLADGRYPEALYNLGIILAESGDRAEAEAAYREAVTQDPDYAAAWINLSLLFSDSGRPDEALQAAVSALEADDTNPKAWFMKAHLLAGAGRREEALAGYREAIRLSPRYTKAMINAAVLEAAAGEDDEAIRLYREALGIDPRNAAAWFNLGLALHRSGRDDEARAAYEQAVSADPEATRAAQNLGVLYARDGRIEDARQVFADGLEREPENTALRYNLVLQLEKLGRTEEALREVRRVISMDPDHARALRVMARLLEAQGDESEADRVRARARDLAKRLGESEGDAQ